MKIGFYLLVLLLFSFAQSRENSPDEDGLKITPESVRGRKDFRAGGGSCAFVIELLRASQGNDSIAITIFKEEYEIVNMRYYERDWLFKQNHNKIIQVFTLEENKKYYCRSKLLKYYGPVLLVD